MCQLCVSAVSFYSLQIVGVLRHILIKETEKAVRLRQQCWQIEWIVDRNLLLLALIFRLQISLVSKLSLVFVQCLDISSKEHSRKACPAPVLHTPILIQISYLSCVRSSSGHVRSS
jgi:hypothetical protein